MQDALRYARSKTTIVAFAIIFSILIVSFSGCIGQEEEVEAQVVTYGTSSSGFPDLSPEESFSNEQVVLSNCYETLLWYNPPGSPELIRKVLATDYSVSEDGLTWTFELRKGVKFHDGTTFDASVVKWNIEHYIEVNTAASFIWGAVDTVTVVDDYTVQLNLKYPDPMDLVVTSCYSAWMMSPSDEDRHDWFNEGHDAGTGPYYIESYDPASQVILKKFDDYWGGWNGPHFDTVVIKIVPEEIIQQQMIESGEADVIEGVPLENIPALQAKDDVVVTIVPSYMNLLGLLNTQKEPLTDPKVRQAICYAVPYQDIVENVMVGYATQARGPIPQGMWGYIPDLFQYQIDLEKAQELLTEAGYPNGLDRPLFWLSPQGTIFEKTAELVKASLAKINIEMEIHPMPLAPRLEICRGDPKQAQDIYCFWWWPTYVTPYDYLYSMFHSSPKPIYNLAYLDDSEVDYYIDEGAKLSGTNRAQATEMFKKAQERLVDQAVAIFFFDRTRPVIYRTSLKGYVDNPAYTLVVLFYECWREEE